MSFDLDFKAGNSPLTSRQNPIIYEILLIFLVIAAIFLAIWFFFLLKKKKTENSEWIEKEKNRKTKRSDINKIKQKYSLSKEDLDLLWNICKKYEIPNIYYSIKKFDELNSTFQKAYQDLKKLNKQDKINHLFCLKFKLDKYFAQSIVYKSSHSIPLKTKLKMILQNSINNECTLEKNTKDYLAISLGSNFPQNQKPEPLKRTAFTFSSATGLKYIFISRVIRYEKNDLEELLILAHTNNLIQKTQRRFKRIDTNEKISFCSVKIQKNEKFNDKKNSYIFAKNSFDGTLTNISGGGCCICANLPIKENQIISVKFNFDSFLDFQNQNTDYAIGKIVKTKKSYIKGYYNLHIKFIDISMEVQNKILAKVYAYD